jgi:hypothetical protein
VVTKVAIGLTPEPSYSRVALVQVSPLCCWSETADLLSRKVGSFDAVPGFLQAARETLGETLSAFEFIDSAAIDAVREADSRIVDRSD